MNISKILRPFLKPTVDERTPTDIQLDSDIEFVSDILHRVSPLLKRIIIIKTQRFFRYRWKFLLGRLILVSLILFLSYVAFIKVMHIQLVPVSSEKVVVYKSDSTMNLRNYLLQLSYMESRWDKSANRPGSQFWGLYQIGADGRKLAGYGDVDYDTYMNHPEIQDLCIIGLLKHNKKFLQKYIDKYEGKIVDGILMTESGILALSHLGTGSCKKYLDSNNIPETDDSGNQPRQYAKLGGYKLNLDHIKHVTDGIN